MNTKSFLVCFIVVMLATSIAMAGTQHGNFAPARGGFVRNGTGSFHGGGLVQDGGRNYDSTIAMKGANALRVQGCAFGGMFCGGQTWKRVS